jgi:6-phosphogluconolactonase
VAHLASLLSKKLRDGQKVLWLVSGGSAIGVEVAVAQKLAGHDLSKLTVMLADERFGPVGHADSNWQQLHDAGFSLDGATLLPVLTGASMDVTVEQFATNLTKQFAAADYRLALLGLGPDGHTAGILPGTPSTSAPGWATAYHTAQFDRITMTAGAITKLDEVVMYAMGETKRVPLEDLHKNLLLDEQPAQAIKAVAKVTIFNDQLGEKA